MISVTPASASSNDIPLVVDVDGTLIKTDLLHESILSYVAKYPLSTWRLFDWVRGGKAALKTALAAEVDPGIDSVPLRDEVLAAIAEARSIGRPVYLASASDQAYVEKLASRLGNIEGAFGTVAGNNLEGTAKADVLVERFGEGGFDYIGDSSVDFAVWRKARKVLAVSHSPQFEGRVRAEFSDAEILASPRPRLKSYIKAMRPHQWAKNALIFVPMFAGHYFDLASLWAAMLAFACFSLAASSAYLLNDLLDLPGDREHARKRRRPMAAGDVPVSHAGFLGIGLLLASILLSLALPSRFVTFLLLYYGTTLAYSLYLKRQVLIDVIVLGGLYALRVLAGVHAIGAIQSPWLLMFCLFIFLSLALLKRCSELIAKQSDGEGALTGRGYSAQDLRVLLPFAAAAGYGAVFVVTLYLSSPEVRPLYDHYVRLWLVCPLLLYWISRAIILCNRGELHDDPVVFALTDKVSWAVFAAIAAVVVASI